VVDASSFLHRELDFAVVAKDDTTGRFKLSRRKVLEREARDRASELRRQIVPDARLHGRVSRLTDFGAFVDLGGVEGMVHVSEISYGRIERPSDVLVAGQEVEVRVLRVGTSKGRRRKKPRALEDATGRISLSIKAAQENPWKSVAERFRPWQVADGRIVRVADFGAFVELAPGIEGLLHDSELPSGALGKLEEASRGGALMAVLVLEVESSRKRISLAPAPGGLEAGERVEPLVLKVGQIVSGRVEEVQAGAVVLRLGPGQMGVIPNPEMGTPRGTDHKADFPRGAEIQAQVLRVEEGGRRARLSRKRAIRGEERAEIERYAKSQSAQGGLSTLGELLESARGEKKR
jgi:ribosomal protein S1